MIDIKTKLLKRKQSQLYYSKNINKKRMAARVHYQTNKKELAQKRYIQYMVDTWFYNWLHIRLVSESDIFNQSDYNHINNMEKKYTKID